MCGYTSVPEDGRTCEILGRFLTHIGHGWVLCNTLRSEYITFNDIPILFLLDRIACIAQMWSVATDVTRSVVRMSVCWSLDCAVQKRLN